MAKISLTRILSDDFPKEYKALLDKLLYKINQSFEQTNNALNNGLTVADNMSAQEMLLDVTAPVNTTNPIYFKNSMKSGCKMILCGYAETISGTPPTGTPFFTFEGSGANIKVTNITNLTDGSRYKLRIYAYT